ncbi:hypothetical protein HOD29_07200 [archaeon]|jgi:hypothetical protein|nr:hypothetical protein [archaeon]
MDEEINNKILNLWEKYAKKGQKGTEHYPLFYPKLRKNCELLFVGVNPSFNEKIMSKKDHSFENKNFDFEKEIDDEGNRKLPNNKKSYKIYFKPIWEMTNKKNIREEYIEHTSWEHIDLFFCRITSQKEFKEIIDYKQQNKKVFMNEFGESQLNLSLEIINNIKPKIIVVANALASEVLQSRIDIDKSGFKQKGYDIAILNENKIPIFFSSMFSGQRALDRGSIRRLKWQIENAIKDTLKKDVDDVVAR